MHCILPEYTASLFTRVHCAHEQHTDLNFIQTKTVERTNFIYAATYSFSSKRALAFSRVYIAIDASSMRTFIKGEVDVYSLCPIIAQITISCIMTRRWRGVTRNGDKKHIVISRSDLNYAWA